MAGTVLLIQLKRVGDVLLCTPLVRAIQEGDPRTRIVFVTEDGNEPVLRGNPRVASLIRIPPRMGWRDWLALRSRLRAEAPDRAIDLSGTPRSCIIAAMSGAPMRIGFRVRAPRRWLYNHVVVPNLTKYTVDRRLDLLRSIGIADRGFAAELYLDESDRREARSILARAGFPDSVPRVALAPASRRDAKRWSAEGFAAAALDAAAAIGGEILVLYGPGEEDQAGEIHALLPGVRRLPQAPGLRAAAAMIESSRVLIANDGGLKHIAVALGTPTVTVFVSTGPAGWHPPDEPTHIAVLARGDLEAELGDVREAIRLLLRVVRS